VNDVGKLGAGEPHARFDRGAAGEAAATASRNRCTRRETGGTEPGRLPLADQPAAYLTKKAKPKGGARGAVSAEGTKRHEHKQAKVDNGQGDDDGPEGWEQARNAIPAT
jgi:hypothetical protein